MTAPAPPPPDYDPPRRETAWERAGRGDARWWAGRGCLALAISSLLTAVLLAAGVFWLAVQIGQAIGEGITEAFGPAIADMTAAKQLVAAPAPPPVAGTAEQAEMLGLQLEAAAESGDMTALVTLLDRGSLLRGLCDPAAAELFEEADFAPPTGGQDAVMNAAKTGLAAVGLPPLPAAELPPGSATAWVYLNMLLAGAEQLPPQDRPSVRFGDVTTLDGLPAVRMFVRGVLSTEESGEPDAEISLLAIPGPDGRVAAIYFEEQERYFAGWFREYLIEATRGFEALPDAAVDADAP